MASKGRTSPPPGRVQARVHAKLEKQVNLLGVTIGASRAQLNGRQIFVECAADTLEVLGHVGVRVKDGVHERSVAPAVDYINGVMAVLNWLFGVPPRSAEVLGPYSSPQRAALDRIVGSAVRFRERLVKAVAGDASSTQGWESFEANLE